MGATMLFNADIGEGLETDKLLYPHLDQANIACGGHAGNQQSMQAAVMASLDEGVIIGAHPSYPDRVNFGRISMQISLPDLARQLRRQIDSLHQVCVYYNTCISYLKPHGALYHDAMNRDDVFELVLDIVRARPSDTAVMLGATLSSAKRKMAQQAGVELILEGFADRQYLVSGELMSRTQSGAVFNNEHVIVRQALRMQQGYVETNQATQFAIKADSLCFHGDNPASVRAIAIIAQSSTL